MNRQSLNRIIKIILILVTIISIFVYWVLLSPWSRYNLTDSQLENMVKQYRLLEGNNESN